MMNPPKTADINPSLLKPQTPTQRQAKWRAARGNYEALIARSEKSASKPFFAWDGEGYTDPATGDHRYMLLRHVGRDDIRADRLGSRKILDFIVRTGAVRKGVIHIIYGGGYDVTHFVRDMPPELRTTLLTSGQVRWAVPETPTEHANSYTLEYLKNKWFTVRGFDWVSRHWVTVKIFDIMTFFQTSFVKACQAYGIDVPDEVVNGKANRNTFTLQDMDEVAAYCQLELDLLVRLAERLRADAREAGINVSQWHGPGAVATAVYRQYRIPDHMKRPDPRLERASQGAYFGGRFEVFKVGHHNGRVWQYDIRSAYPSYIQNLPSLRDAVWERVTEYGGPGVYLCDVDAEGPFGPVPHRSRTGMVSFPLRQTGVWLWHHEALLPGVTIRQGFRLVANNDTLPFSFVDPMFDTRARWKREGKGAERMLKLALNSLYGKSAQRVGGKDGKPPQLHQLEWAGMTTSGTRSQLYRAMLQKPDAVIAVETDALFVTEEIDLDIGTGLGQWERTDYEWITYVQSGVYWTDNGLGSSRAKTRGIRADGVTYDDVERYLRGDTTSIATVARNFIALGNPRKGLYGQWIDDTREIIIPNVGKRIHYPPNCRACQAGLGLMDRLHDTIITPLAGVGSSNLHQLPWRDEGDIMRDDGADLYELQIAEEHLQ